MESGVAAEHYETLYFHPGIGTQPPSMALPTTASVWLNRLRTGVGRFRSLHKREWPILCLVTVAQNRPLTILSFAVQSIVLECKV